MDIKYNFVDSDGNVVNTMTFSTDAKKNEPEKKEPCFLDGTLIQNFREAINSSPIFIESDKHKNRYNLTCAVMDRIETAIKVLNSPDYFPDTEDRLITYCVFACILKDGIYALYENIFSQKPPTIDDKCFFIDIRDYVGNVYRGQNDFATDDTFFEYYRALAFAHPFSTTKARNKARIFMQDGEEQCSPWVIYNNRSYLFTDLKIPIGIRLYSNKYQEGLRDIYFSFNCLQGYIEKRYGLLKELADWAKSEIKDQEKIWKAQKITRSDDAVETLKNAAETLKSRFVEAYEIEELIEYLSCKTTLEQNKERIETYRDAIKNIVPQICDSIDELDYEKMYDIIFSVKKRPKHVNKNLDYQLEKIFSYLEKANSGSNIEFGLMQAEAFANGFAKKWVCIKPYVMPYSETKLLVQVACYYEWLEENNKK